METSYHRVREETAEIAKQVLQRPAKEETAISALCELWEAAVQSAYSDISAIQDSTPLFHARMDLAPLTSSAMNTIETSPFLSVFHSSRELHHLWSDDPRFVNPRLVTNLLYKTLSCLGLRAIDRFTLCFLAFRTVEDINDIDLKEVLRETLSKASLLITPKAPYS